MTDFTQFEQNRGASYGAARQSGPGSQGESMQQSGNTRLITFARSTPALEAGFLAAGLTVTVIAAVQAIAILVGAF